MASSILNLLYYPTEDTFYFTDLEKVEPKYRTDFFDFLNDIIVSTNISNPSYNIGLEYNGTDVSEVNLGSIGDAIGYYNRDTGDSAIPFSQTITITNIPAAQIVTGYDPDTEYHFEFEVQNDTYTFFTTGASLVTYQDVFDFIKSQAPITFQYFNSSPSSVPFVNFSSSTKATAAVTNDNGGTTTPSRSSSIEMRKFANEEFANGVYDDSKTGTGGFATFSFEFDEPEANQILTLVPNTSDTVFQFAIGAKKNLAVQGSQARTYQDLIDTINLFDDINALFVIDADNKHQFHLYVPIPKSPTIDATITAPDVIDPDIIKENASLRGALESYVGPASRVNIEDFSGLTTNSSILHLLGNSIYGGYNLLTVLQNSKRSNGSYWTEVIPIENDQTTSDEIVSLVPEQATVVNAINDDDTLEDEDKRHASVNLNTIVQLNPTLITGGSGPRSDITDDAAALVPSVNESFNDPDPDPDVLPKTEDADAILANINDDGVDPDALNDDGSVNDESKLTTAQKSKLLPPNRTTVG